MVLSGSSPIHRLLGSFESVPEVRTLPSPDVTRLHQYYDPLRLPPQPPVQITVLGLTQPRRVSPVARITFPACRAHYPGGSNGCACRLLPRPRGLPRFTGGSASATSLSRPAQASLTLRPARLLNRPRRPLSRGSDPDDCSSKPLVSYQINRQLSGWNLPPLVIRAVGAH